MTTVQTLQERSDFLARCTRCSQCKFVASPRSQRHASACPGIDHGQFHAFSAGGQLIMGYGLLSGDLDYSEELLDVVGSCTMCGNCDSSCKVNFGETVEPLDSLYALRAKLVDEGHSPAAHRTLMDNFHSTGNAQALPRTQRAQWAQDLDLPTAGADLLLHVGSELAHDPSRWPALRAIVQALRSVGITVSHLGADEGPSGGTAFDLGYVDDAAGYARSLQAQIRASGASTVVTFSANALAAFRSVYPRLGIELADIRVLHYSEYLLQLIDSGRLPLPGTLPLRGHRVAYHDSCKLGRLSEPWTPHALELDDRMSGILVSRAPQALRFGTDGCYEPPRMLLQRLGLEVVELERSRASSYCCGACGGVKQTRPDAANNAARNRLAELHDSGSSTLVSACLGCSSHLADNVQAGTQVLDLLDLLAQALLPQPSETRR